jgi:cytochrome c553
MNLPTHARSALLALTLACSPHLAAAQDATLARSLAATCANCHGTDGRAQGDMRPLAGMPAQTQLAMLAGFRNGTLPATVMHQLVKGYSDEQLALIAGFYAAQSPRP